MDVPTKSDSYGPVPGGGRLAPVPVTLLLFAAAREAAGQKSVLLAATTVGDVLDQARAAFGEAFTAVLEGSRVWLNGEPAKGPDALAPGDEVAVLPPVSGG
jgi:molybdopterin synthase sulfur carrier subunit